MIGALAAAAGPVAGALGGGGSSDMQSVGPVYSGGSQGGISVNTGGSSGMNPWAIGGIVLAVVGAMGGVVYFGAKG